MSISAHAQSFSRLEKAAIDAYKQHDFETAKKFAALALEKKPLDFQIVLLLGDAEFFLKNYQKALVHYDFLLNKINSSEIYFRKGNTLLELNRENEAIMNFRHILTSEPDRADVHRIISKVYFDQKDFDKALIEIGKAEKIDPNSSATIFGKAKILMKLGRQQESCQYLSNPAITESPEVKILKEINCQNISLTP